MKCEECEFYDKENRKLNCDPVKVTDSLCLQRLIFVKVEWILRTFQAIQETTEKLAPLQEKLMKRQLDELEGGEDWKK